MLNILYFAECIPTSMKSGSICSDLFCNSRVKSKSQVEKRQQEQRKRRPMSHNVALFKQLKSCYLKKNNLPYFIWVFLKAKAQEEELEAGKFL